MVTFLNHRVLCAASQAHLQPGFVANDKNGNDDIQLLMSLL